ncbi:MAG: RHS repeat-associated core domain-containing protein, partial [Deltaproteobacteria bacterium]|nr:RHS repeat-associated core domain-containing protein [Deltaproteobacteria bacterium]
DTSDTSSPVLPEYRSYDYDPIGNRKQTVEVANTGTYTTNALNQYTQQNPPGGGTNNFTYDFDGNLTEISDGSTSTKYRYNGENRLIAVQPKNPVNGNKKAEFTYDYMGRRVQKIVSVFDSGAWITNSEKRFVYDGWNLIGELTIGESQSIEKYYVWGLDLSHTIQGAGGVGGLMASVEILAGDFDGDGVIDGADLAELANNPDLMDLSIFSANFGKENSSSSGTNYVLHYYLYDGNGNVGQLVESVNGDVVAHYEYDAFGKVSVAKGTQTVNNPYQFSTKYSDGETGLVYYGYRYYDPETGRWLSRDAIEEKDTLNLYLYSLNDAINGYDLLGLYTLFDSGFSVCSPRCKGLPGRAKSKCQEQCMVKISDQEIFDAWFELENKRGEWWIGLPLCPQKLCKDEKGKPKKPKANSDKWDNPRTPPAAESALHPNPKTKWSMRSKPISLHANQCLYDANCELLRTPPSSGTVDWFHPITTTFHFDHDVAPIYLADFLDFGGPKKGFFRDIIASPFIGSRQISTKVGTNMSKYFRVRPLHAVPKELK